LKSITIADGALLVPCACAGFCFKHAALQTQPSSLVRCMDFIQRFRAHALWRGEEMYCFTLLVSRP
jgi:hypothetical protein